MVRIPPRNFCLTTDILSSLEIFLVNHGEVDIIAIDHNSKENDIVFVEVKSRIDKRCGNPAEAVDQYKQRHIYKVAEYYLMINHLENHFVRFDIVEVLGKKNARLQINHIKNAFINPFD